MLAIVGIWGFFTSSILGIFGVNAVQSVLHLIAAIAGIYAGTKGIGKDYNMIIGVIGVALGILGFIPGISGLLASWFNIDSGISVLHIVIGAVSLLVYYKAK